jgi:hypothetical protein
MAIASIISLPLEAAKVTGYRYFTHVVRSKANTEIRFFVSPYEAIQHFGYEIDKEKWKDIENSLEEHKAWKGEI